MKNIRKFETGFGAVLVFGIAFLGISKPTAADVSAMPATPWTPATSGDACGTDARGPFEAQTFDLRLPSGPAKVAYPAGAAKPSGATGAATPSAPVVVLAHGAYANPSHQIGWGQHLASFGFVAIVPSFCLGPTCGPVPEEAEAIVRQALDYLRDNALPANAAVRSDVNRFGLMGHSAGGRALTFAATNLQPAALVLLDPVSGRKPFDRETSPAKEALSMLAVPTLTLYAEEHQSPVSCNKNSLWKTFGNGSAGFGLSAVVRGGSHCDGENPARRLCGVPFLGCGKAATKGYQDAIAQYATAWLQTHLKGDATFAPCVAPARLMQDARLREVEVYGN